jgi:hypothetical protein
MPHFFFLFECLNELRDVDAVFSHFEVLIPFVLDKSKSKILLAKSVESGDIKVEFACCHTHEGDSIDKFEVSLDGKFILIELLLACISVGVPFETLNL